MTICNRKLRDFALFLITLMLMMLSYTAAIADDPFEGMQTYEAGQYKVGRDFISGEYVLLNTSDYSAYFAITSDANGKDIIVNGLFDVNSIITVNNGEYLELKRCIAISAKDFYASYTIRTDHDGTMLRVGYDILPGEYKLIAASGKTGYYCIYNNSRQDDIIDNDLFENSSWVTVTTGQYLVLNRCHIQQ